MENFDTDEAGYILYVDSAKVTTQTEYGEEIDYLYGLYLDGEYDGTPST